MILIDTSAWIDFFNQGTGSTHGQRVLDLIASDHDIALCGIIVTEILQGIAREQEADDIRRYLLDFPMYEPGGIDCYLSAANIYRQARKRGITLRSSSDCLIAAIALEHNLTILHKDRDFGRIATVVPLECVPV